MVASIAIPSVGGLVGVAGGWFETWFLVLAIAPVIVLWLFVGTRYDVSNDHLTIRWGPFRHAHPLASIRSLRAVRDPLSANGASIESVEVHQAGGLLVLSPRNPEVLVSAIRSRAPHVELEEQHVPTPDRPGGRLRTRGDRTTFRIVVGLECVSVLGFVAMLYAQARPTLVMLAPDRITMTSLLRSASLRRADITGISLETAWPGVRRRLGGTTSFGSFRGRFELDGLGTGYVFADRGTPPYVLVRTRQSFALLGLADATRTRRLYDALRGGAAVR